METFKQLIDEFSPYSIKYDPASLPSIAYHYTDAAGLVGMLANGSIWATEYRFLNDRSEVLHTHALVRSLINRRLADAPEPKLANLYARILRALDAEQDTEVCVSSLSRRRDDLSQWRGYARDGQGFTIGFDVDAVVTKAKEDDPLFGFARVEYEEGRQLLGLERALSAVEKRFLADAGADVEKASVSAAVAFDAIIWNRGVVNKHSSFEAEDEWRIFSFCNEGEALKVRSGKSGLVPYMEISAEELCGSDKLPIKEIGIGPGFPAKDQTPAIRALCRQYGYDPVIYPANAPYRSN